MNESMPSSAQPAQEAQKPRTWFFVSGVFVDEGMRLFLRSEALYEADAAFARASLGTIQRLSAQRRRGRRENTHVQHGRGNVRRRSESRLIEIQERGNEIVFAVRVSPRASRDGIAGEHQGATKIQLTAPPVDDRANEALRRLLAERLKVPVSAVRIIAGERSRTKRVSIMGATREQIAKAFDRQPS